MAGENTEELLLKIVSATQEQAKTNEKILTAVQEIQSKQAHDAEHIDELTRVVGRHEEILRGNGKPGILTLLETLAPLVQDHQRVLRGSEDKDGLVGKVKSLEGRAEGMAKPLWLLLSALIASGITVLVSHLVGK